MDKHLGLIDSVNNCISDPRNPIYTVHQQRTMLAQRIFGIALGYEDLNDHQTLREDPLFQIVSDRGVQDDMPLASPPTLCRLENRVDRKALADIARVFVENFIASYKKEPDVLVLDLDATDDPVHRNQDKRFFHGYYDHYCFLPLFGDFMYAAQTWDCERRVIVKAEHIREGSNSRFIVTNLSGQPQYLYDEVYCRRGEAENRIKEQQLGLFADRTSCHNFVANQFRVLLSSAAYILMDSLRREAPVDTELSNAQVDTIRLKLLKIGARIVCSVRRIVFHLASGYPFRELFVSVLKQLRAFERPIISPG